MSSNDNTKDNDYNKSFYSQFLNFEDLKLQEYSDDSDEEDVDSIRSSKIFSLPEDSHRNDEATTLTLYTANVEKEGRVEVDSDEERDIIANIKEEILRQVREEMKDELAQIKNEPENADCDKTPTEEEILDEKIKDGMLRIKKLDAVLLKKLKKERDVKRNRIYLEKCLREELREMECQSGRQSTDEKTNLMKFLAIKMPQKHNDIPIFEDDSPPSTPLFQTEYLPTDSAKSSTTSPSKASSSSTKSKSTGRNTGEDSTRKRKGKSNRSKTNSENGNKSRSDFIKRNIELASQAGELVAMTEDERKRLDSLLVDLDAIDELVEEDIDLSNPFQIKVAPGEGFSLDAVEYKQMSQIDTRLRDLMIPEDYDAIMKPNEDKLSYKPSLFVRMQLEGGIDVEKLGEDALKESKLDRESKMRIETLDRELEALKSARDPDEVVDASLIRPQLNDLLHSCARSFSRSTTSRLETDRPDSNISMDSDSEAYSSSRCTSLAEVLENPPHLENSVLQQLLLEAQQSGIRTASHLCSTIEENEEEDLTPRAISQNGDTEEGTSTIGDEYCSKESSNEDNTNGGRLFKRPQRSPPLTPSKSLSNNYESKNRPVSTESSIYSAGDSRSDFSDCSHSSEYKDSDRLILPDINLFQQKTAPKSSQS